MKVKLLSRTLDPEHLIGIAARSCWTQEGASKLNPNPKKLEKLAKREVERGHESILEHAKFTFSIEGISRACSHQLVRHRIASYSQQSQRAVKIEEPDYVTPPQIQANSKLEEKYEQIMNQAWKNYRELLDSKIPREDARFVLPNAAKTNIVMTMNARSLLHFLELRCCLHAQWEIRELAWKILSQTRKVAPTIFENAGPPCITRGECPEQDSECKLYGAYVG
ncbi:hypothetical protein AKJ47_01165 [candidate division MSBL1 archaeon SCGC-AAA261G05]|uniref:Flavin-dependent thymidylate synthase n=4 Tax=candidate division MSBL1 TaxID=215777 RepID=A0A133V0B7_9EURY|nr:hypothetical protein AKJ42_02320 [candidate division MSBL1 archaeon SCGC-AAA261C02]KXB03991.1 hypothetical protein AKJ47_01165 [candidate division MSBL1 archaeon SCGC-AAA261G05]